MGHDFEFQMPKLHLPVYFPYTKEFVPTDCQLTEFKSQHDFTLIQTYVTALQLQFSLSSSAHIDNRQTYQKAATGELVNWLSAASF